MSESVQSPSATRRRTRGRDDDQDIREILTQLRIDVARQAAETDKRFAELEQRMDKRMAEMETRMEKRMAELEKRMEKYMARQTAAMENLGNEMRTMKENMVTKAEAQQAENRILRWMMAGMVSLTAIVVALLRLFP